MLETALSILGVVVTTASLVYAVKTNQEKRGRERLVQEKLAGISGSIESIRQSARWADGHFGQISDHAKRLERGDAVTAIIGEAHTGARDAVAADRMLGNLLGDVLALQRGLFGTEVIRHPDRGAGS